MSSYRALLDGWIAMPMAVTPSRRTLGGERHQPGEEVQARVPTHRIDWIVLL